MRKIFREARLSDIKQMQVIRNSVTENELSDPSKITEKMYIDFMQTLGKAWVCDVDNKVVGFSYAAINDASIWALFIQKEFEGNGIGTKLLSLATNWLFEQGADRVKLSTTINTRAERFYEALGWIKGDFNTDEVEFFLVKNEK